MGFRRSAVPARVWSSLGALTACAAVVALGGAAGSAAGLPTITGTQHTSTPCPPDSGREFCVVLTTYDGVQRSGGLRVDLQLLNYDQNTLTNPFISLTWLPYDEVSWSDPKPSSCSELPDPATARPDDTRISCAFANLPGLGSASGPAADPVRSPVVTLYFNADVIADLQWRATGFVNERGHDPSDVPNADARPVTASTVFGTDDANQAATFGLPGSDVQLGALDLGDSSLQFAVPPGAAPFQALFAADATTDFCFGGLTCIPLQLTSSVPGPTGLQIQTFRIRDTNLNPRSLRIIHRYDARSVTAIAGSKFQTDVSYNRIDGVNLTTLSGSGLPPAKDYFVVNPTSSTFQISEKRGGKPISFPAGGTADAGRIRIIGDERTELAASCSVTDLSVNIPSIFAFSISRNDIQGCLGDSENGRIGPGG